MDLPNCARGVEVWTGIEPKVSAWHVPLSHIFFNFTFQDNTMSP